MPSLADKVEHVVVLMLENRSFDHMLGFLPHPDPSYRGLSGNESNPENPKRPEGRRFTVREVDEPETVTRDPGHGFGDVMRQMYGRKRAWRRSADQTPTQDGFAWVHDKRTLGLEKPGDVLKAFAPRRVPVLSKLALEYAVCDMWFSPVPGATWPNRLFCHAATSVGTVDNVICFYKLRTIFHALDEVDRSWRVYREGVTQVGSFVGLEREGRESFFSLEKFEQDAAAGALPNYAFIEPDYFWPGRNDQHPKQDVAHGERLIARIYDAVRAGPGWEKTLLIVTYDEHGGFFDHVPPPKTVAPDGWRHREFRSFNFSRLGPRVPAVLVSPWIEPGTVDHQIYDHTAIIKSLRERFGITSRLTRRDEWAHSFWHLLRRERPRTDEVRVEPRDVTDHEAMQLDGLQDGFIALARQLEMDHDVDPDRCAEARLAGRPEGSLYMHSSRRLRFGDVDEARRYLESIAARFG